jgi:hypothetical protein
MKLKKPGKQSLFEIAALIEDRFNFSNNPSYDGGIHKAILEFSEGHEPRTEFIFLSKLSCALIKLLNGKDGEAFFKKVDGFKDYDEAFDRLTKFNKLMVALTHWHVDGFIQYKRIMDGSKFFSEEEKAALSDVYLWGEGNEGEKKSKGEEVLTAASINY